MDIISCKEMTLSIIIPVYCVENTLDRCLESIIKQFPKEGTSFFDWEILLIDDGSPDSCPEICDRWAYENPYITVYHKKNGGLSEARNYGIERATGDWITFVDSDDEITPNTYSALMSKIEEQNDFDVIEFPVLVYAGSERERLLELPSKKWDCARSYWHETLAWEHCYAWNKIYRKSIFENVRFPEGRVFEDVWTWVSILSKNPRIVTVLQGRYIYNCNPKGITGRASSKEILQLFVSQLRSAVIMRTTPFSKNGGKLYRSMVCRLFDSMNFFIKKTQRKIK